MLRKTEKRLVELWVEEFLKLYYQARSQPDQLPIPLWDIAEGFFGLRVDIESLQGRFSDVLAFHIPSKRWIILNRDQSPQRQAFSLAHEIAHWLIDYGEPSRDDHGLAYPSGLRSENPQIREAIANHFAGALLIPKNRLIDCVLSLKSIDTNDIHRIAKIFNVSYQAMHIRLQEIQESLNRLGIEFRPDECYPITHLPGVEKIPHRKFTYTVARLNLAHLDHEILLDHNVLRKLVSLKKQSQKLIIDCGNLIEEHLEALLAFECVDGFIIPPNSLYPSMDETLSSNEGDIQFLNYEYGTWVNDLIQKGPTIKEYDFRVIFTRSQNEQLICEQPRLIDISKFIVAPVALNHREQAKAFVRQAKSEGNRVVIVTGCFDLITDAHIKFLRRAKAAGDILMVGIEADNRVRAFKGLYRPVNTISQRVEVIDALEFVDFTFVIYGSPKADIKKFYTRLHQFLQADLLAISEGDPHLDDRRDEIEAGGGKIAVVSRQELNSTTSLIRRFLRETEYSDLVIVSKDKLKEHILENENGWRQLQLPILIQNEQNNRIQD